MNDYVRQIIPSCPIPLSKICLAPTTSTLPLVLRMSLPVCTFRIFRIFLEQRAVIRSLARKSFCASAIATELQPIDGTEALALSTVKKWRTRFAERRTSRYDDPRGGKHLTKDLAKVISFMLKNRPYLSCKVLCRYFGIAKRTCEFFMICSA
jgi:hypothetical protein